MEKLGVNINKGNNKGDTPFTFSCQNGEITVIKDLVKHGADINKKTRMVRTHYL